MDELHGLRVREVLPLGHFDPGVDDAQPRPQERRRLFQLLNLHRPPLSQAPRLRRLLEKMKSLLIPVKCLSLHVICNSPHAPANPATPNRMVPVQRSGV